MRALVENRVNDFGFHIEIRFVVNTVYFTNIILVQVERKYTYHLVSLEIPVKICLELIEITMFLDHFLGGKLILSSARVLFFLLSVDRRRQCRYDYVILGRTCRRHL